MIPIETRRLFRNRNFLHLWANHALQQIAYSMVNFTLMIWVFKLTKINLAVSLWVLAFLIPSVSLSMIAGVLADNFDRRKIIIATDLLWALVVLSFAFARNSFPLILAITFIAQGIDEFFFPSQNAALPRLVGKRELLPANSLFSLTITVALVIGFLLAGPLLRFFGYFAPFVLASCLVSLGAFSVFFLPPIEAARQKRRLSISPLAYLRKELGDELRILAGRREIFTTGLFMALLYGGMGAAGAVVPGFMEQGLRIDAKDISFVGGIPATISIVLGTALIGRFGNRWGEKKMIKAGLLVFGISLLFLSSSPVLRTRLAGQVGTAVSTVAGYSSRLGINEIPIPFERLPGFSLLVATLVFILSAALTFIMVPVTTLLQKITPDVARGRTFGAFSMLTSVSTAFFVVSAGFVADLYSPVLLVALVGLVAMFFAFTRERVLGWVFGVVSGRIKIRNPKHQIRNKFK